jgi:type I restriction enzyme R subunit
LIKKQKTLVFCADQPHPLVIRDLINQMKESSDTNYCVSVTAYDGEEGERWLRVFQDNEKTIPTILTTSQKLSTGVDARNIRNIILMRPINSMIEFKQIVGRGTRLFEGKEYFTIYDFVKAYEHFNDPEWDGEPLEPEVCSSCNTQPCVCEKTPPKVCATCGLIPCECEIEPCSECEQKPCVCEKRKKIRIKLADGKERSIQHMIATSFWNSNGTPMSATDFIKKLFGDLPELFKDEDELRAIWSKPDTRKKLLEGLQEKGYGEQQLKEVSILIDAEKSDIFDVLAYISFSLSPITREERVKTHTEQIYQPYSDKQKDFLEFVLGHYIDQGVGELDSEKLPDLLELKYNSIADAVNSLGDVKDIRKIFIDFQEKLYD